MPIAYQFDPSRWMLEVFATGQVSVDDRVEFVAKATFDDRLPDEVPVLIDVSGLENSPSSDDLPAMARLVELLAIRFKSRVAYFVTGVGIVTPYLLAAAQVDTELAQARTFTNRHEAIVWLRSS